MTGNRKGKRFIRTRISRTETLISGLLLLLLTGIGVTVYVKGQSYDPGLFRLDISALLKGQPARTQPAPLVIPGDAASSGTSSETPALPPPPAGLLDGLAPAGWKALGDATQFTAATLYEKIDGRAESYLDFKFVRLTCASLVNDKDKGQFIDIYVFDMGRPANAFGVFSVERSEGLPAVSLGREGYRSEASYFFWKGRYYVQVLASDKGTKLAEVGLTVAGALAKRLEDKGEVLWGLTALPEKDRIPGSVQFFVTDAMSLDFMKDTYLARYVKDRVKVTVFLAQETSAAGAVKTLASYEAYVKNFGKVAGREDTADYTLLAGDMGGAFDVVFRKGRLIGGVSMAESRAVAEKTARELLSSSPPSTGGD